MHGKPTVWKCIQIAETSSSRSDLRLLHLLHALRIKFQRFSSVPPGTKFLPITCSLVLEQVSNFVPQYGQVML